MSLAEIQQHKFLNSNLKFSIKLYTYLIFKRMLTKVIKFLLFTRCQNMCSRKVLWLWNQITAAVSVSLTNWLTVCLSVLWVRKLFGLNKANHVCAPSVMILMLHYHTGKVGNMGVKWSKSLSLLKDTNNI